MGKDVGIVWEGNDVGEAEGEGRGEYDGGRIGELDGVEVTQKK